MRGFPADSLGVFPVCRRNALADAIEIVSGSFSDHVVVNVASPKVN